MTNSKGWEWKVADQSPWLKPTEDAYYLSRIWKDKGLRDILDLGSGLGRHAILFAEEGFNVSAIDISEYATEHLRSWAGSKKLSISIFTQDMNELPFADESLDAVFAYHSISHSDTYGVKKFIQEIRRVLRSGGEFYTSFCSKHSEEFMTSNYPKIDENTILNKEEGPEYDVPHFYVDVDDILELLIGFDIEKIKHTNYCYLNNVKTDNQYYYVMSNKQGD